MSKGDKGALASSFLAPQNYDGMVASQNDARFDGWFDTEEFKCHNSDVCARNRYISDV